MVTSKATQLLIMPKFKSICSPKVVSARIESKVMPNMIELRPFSLFNFLANPSNGYYFLPIYDKGSYVLKVLPPPGWSFEPDSVEINFDGETDPCSLEQDVNFVFKGFGITGRVELLGQKSGAAGLNVELLQGGSVVKTVKTNSNGVFSFSPLQPGEYKVRAVHPTWYLGKSEATVKVTTGNTELPAGSFQVTGFNIKGRVRIFLEY